MATALLRDSTAATRAAATTKTLDILATLRPHRINAWRGATVADIEHCGRQLASILDLAADVPRNLNEHLPVTATVDAARIADLKDDLLGALTDAAEAVS